MRLAVNQSHIYVYGTIRACGLSRAEFEAFFGKIGLFRRSIYKRIYQELRSLCHLINRSNGSAALRGRLAPLGGTRPK